MNSPLCRIIIPRSRKSGLTRRRNWRRKSGRYETKLVAADVRRRKLEREPVVPPHVGSYVENGFSVATNGKSFALRVATVRPGDGRNLRVAQIVKDWCRMKSPTANSPIKRD